jgi:DNA-directed RNA polymerase beta subunit
VSGFLRETVMERSDKCTVPIDRATGFIESEPGSNTSEIQIPYSFKLLMQELQAMSIGPRVVS